MTSARQAISAELIQGDEKYVQAQPPKDLRSLAEVNDTFASSLHSGDQLLWRQGVDRGAVLARDPDHAVVFEHVCLFLWRKRGEDTDNPFYGAATDRLQNLGLEHPNAILMEQAKQQAL